MKFISMWEDFQCSILLLCATFGVGSLSMPYVFAQAGLGYGTGMLLFVSLSNLISCILLSEMMLAMSSDQPKTYGDLASELLGVCWKWIIVVTQAGTCLLTPIAFLLLSGKTLLPLILQGLDLPLNQYQWTVVMACLVLPFILIPTLKEAIGVAIVGFLAMVLTALLALLAVYQEEQNPFLSTDPKLEHVFDSYGTLTFAFGTSCLVPTIQNVHSQPNRMKNILFYTLVLITLIYGTIGYMGYFHYGCKSPENILFQIQTYQRSAAFFMLVHVAIAYIVVLNPTLYLIERAFFSIILTKQKTNTATNTATKTITTQNQESTPFSIGDQCPLLETDPNEELHNEEKQSSIPFLLPLFIRSGVLLGQVGLSLLFMDSFTQVLNVIGSTTVMISCMVAPSIMYLKKHQQHLQLVSKIFIYLFILINLALGIFVALRSLKVMIMNGTSLNPFPFCFSKS